MHKKLINFVIFFLFMVEVNCNLSGCEFPENIQESRDKRLHHPCEQNKNQLFAIEFKNEENFYCVYYSSLETSLFGDERAELTIDGDFEVTHEGAEGLNIDDSKISFNISMTDVTLKISKRSYEKPKIISVIVNNEEYCEREHCGVRSDAVPVIIGGNQAREGAWPWHVALYLRPSVGTLIYRCGSTIINKKTVISTASCLVTFDASLQNRVAIKVEKLMVGVGETVLYDTSAASRQLLQIDEVKFHEMFKLELSEDDVGYKDDFNVALLILKDEIKYSLHVQPICLPSFTDDDDFDYDNQVGNVVGWGYTEEKGSEISRHLQELIVKTNKFLTCFFRAENRNQFLGFSASRNFCAGYQNKRGICTGDAGGGLYIKIDSKFYIFGLAYHANCQCDKIANQCKIINEGIFVNLIEFMQWIHNNMF